MKQIFIKLKREYDNNYDNIFTNCHILNLKIKSIE
jgi:hypothetical protein